MELKDLVKIGTPLLGSILGGPPGLAAGATSLVIKTLGLSSNSSLQDIAKEIQTNPDAAFKLRELEVKYQQYLSSVRLQMDQAEYADRASARSREVEITKATGKKDWYPSALGTFVVLAFTLIICVLILAPPKKDDPNQSVINVLIGALAAGYSTVLGYYFGSSAGSRGKDESIAAAAFASNSSQSLRAPLHLSSQEKEAEEKETTKKEAAKKETDKKETEERFGLMPPEVAQLNHHYEGCILKAYPDPASGDKPITIGWGSTFHKDGSPIRMGEEITQIQADELYDYNCYHKFWKVLEATIPHWQSMSSKHRAALCSFAYNNGARFYGDGEHDTIDRCLRDRRWEQVPGAMMMYRNPGENVEVGLGRRRRAEGLVWIGFEPSKACEQAELEINTPTDCESLEQQLKANPPDMVTIEQGQVVPPSPRPNLLGIWMPPLGVTDFTIPVKHYTQNNNMGGRGYRECFKTSCTMLADHVTNGKLSKLQKEQGLSEPEDVYQSYMDGDTTDYTTHERALKELGIDAYFTNTASIADVEKSLDLGIPVPIGVKYKPDTEGGGGHWVLVNGRGPSGWDVLCPYGIRDGATDTWLQIFQTEAEAKQDSFSRRLLKAIFTDLGDENGYALFVTAVNGISTGVFRQL